jgi:D-alanyl-D-alanine dipeptidase
VLLSDPRVAAVPVRDSGEPLTELDESFGSPRALVRVSVARRLALARAGLPKGLGLRVIEGYRTAAAQRAIIRSYADEIRVSHPAVGAAELERLTSRFVAPMAVAPHVAGAAVDLTRVDSGGRELTSARRSMPRPSRAVAPATSTLPWRAGMRARTANCSHRSCAAPAW